MADRPERAGAGPPQARRGARSTNPLLRSDERKQMQGRVLLLTICAAGIGGTFQFGYNLSIINAPTLHIQEFINETWSVRTGQPLPRHLVLLVWSLIVSLYPLGGLFGALLAGPLAVMLGRHTERGRDTGRGRKQIPCMEPNAGLDPGTSGSHPGPKADAQPLSYPGAYFVRPSALLPAPPALQRLRGTADVAQELSELDEERAACRGQRARRPWELLQDRGLRRQVTSLAVLGGALELCGNDSVYAVASSVFRGAGVPDAEVQYAVVGTGSCELLAACVSCVLIERVGRRVLLIAGYSLMTCWGSIFTVALCLQSSVPWMPYLAMSCIFAFILSFGIGPAGVTGILATELFDQKSRPAAYMVCGVLMWILLFLVGLGFPFIMEGLSHFFYVPFLGVCVCGAIYTAFFLPETKGKSFLEISEELDRLKEADFLKQNQGPDWSGPEVILSTEL
ncbi:solute carrier family 2, facilitated glucose transporter member 11 [Canis lupus baileyi]|uniref:solute carrier family 2, facilitated glucose transporter member 11 n=1 Tax=Canis lupus baileyi TaxID=143281 RepID=UPI003B96E599